MSSTPRTPAPDRPPPPVPPPPIQPPSPSPSPPGEEYHTPTPSWGEASPPEEASSADDGAPIAKSPPLSPVRFPSPHRLPPPVSAADNNGQATPSPARHARPQLVLTPGLVRTPSQGSAAGKSLSPSPSPPSPPTPAPAAKFPSPSPLTPAPVPKSPSPSPSSPLSPVPAAKSPTPSPLSPPSPVPAAKSPSPSPPSPPSPVPAAKSPSPSPPSLLTPTPPAKSPSQMSPAAAPAVNSSKSGKSTPKHREAWKPPPPPPIVPTATAPQFDPAEEALTSPLRIGKPRIDQQRLTPAAAENGAAAGAAVPPDVAAVARVGERRALSVALRLATAVLSLASFSLMVSARTSGWAGDYYGRHQQYRYAVGVNVIVCAYSIAQCVGEIRRLISPRFMFRSMSSYYFSLFLDQVLAYLLVSASSAAASHNDLWVSRFGTDPFNKKINSAVWLSFIAFLTIAANALISTANLFSMV